ncbi:MAG: lipocalin family protein [Pseudomonadota bacterium]
MTLANLIRRARLSAVFATGLLLAACASGNDGSMDTVSGFDVDRYLGEWHQVAAIPVWFQRDCVANTTATYGPGEDDLIAVTNRCEIADGTFDEADGRARFQGDPTDGKLEVTFVDVFGEWVWATGGDYWIIGLDPDYRWSVVGHPSREYGWVLARTPTLDAATLATVDGILKDEGYDTCTLMMTTPDQTGPLCQVAGG